MSPAFAVELVRQTVTVTLLVAAPLLAAALVVGVIVSIVQAVTQIQEQTLTFVPKLLVVAFVALLTLPWALSTLVEFLARTFRTLPGIAS